jgi:hypothetical protein
MSAPQEQLGSSDSSSIALDEDTTLTPETQAARREPRRRRHRRRLTDEVKRRVMRSNVIRVVVGVVLSLAVVAFSTYLARKSMDVEFSVTRSPR